MVTSNSTPKIRAKLAAVAALLLALTGCATCQQHPLACGVAGAIVVGSVAASVGSHDNRAHDNRAVINGTPCGHFWAC
jgi:hypothetical protein